LSVDQTVTRVFGVASTRELTWAQVEDAAWSDSFAEGDHVASTEGLDLRIRALRLQAAD